MDNTTQTPEAVPPAEWLRRIEAATADHIRSRIVLDNLIANARAAGVPMEQIEGRSPYDYGLALHAADRVDAERITGHTAPEHLIPAHDATTDPQAPVIVGPLLGGALDREVSVAHKDAPAALRACADQQQFEEFVRRERPDLDPNDATQVHWAGHPEEWPENPPEA
ncbi:hypothetical protein GXW83_18145 [Streptacidiphilus sp. PB12-B1b]|uniref:hypothetical protein n=1 Tax=Streptacidiphilus sp. PB12-B1b TaxID=2705012 RepID=UPI0015FD12E6|nr:hypothetical protein [Streptacidiphilus sp. PB12-B1b]QMU77333.1 hypothetical protein GXW83_18145 [Streptacidiphilus sp. PB12-B1b]